MTPTSKTIIFFGTDSFSEAALRHLIQAGYPVGAVVTKPDAHRGRGHKLMPPEVKILALQHDIPVWQPARLDEIIEPIKAFGDTIGVLSSFGRLIPESILQLFTPGIINIHPSLLPAYRGPTPIETAIANGDEKTGVSLMLLVKEMDAGPLYAQADYPLTGNETQPELYEALADLGGSLLMQHLPHIISGELTPRDQLGPVSYSRLLHKSDALADPGMYTAEQLARKVRAHLSYPKTKLTLLGQLVTITAAHSSPERTSILDVTCSDGHFLVIDELVGPSGRRMNGAAFLNGYHA